MFLRLGLIVAWLAVIVGSVRFGAGIYAASLGPAKGAAFAARYLGGASLTEADPGLMVLLFGIVLGVLVEIGRAVSR